ncbi:MAG: chemotaxis protein CheD [Bdellovibrionales bacterium]|nr:chemotaxis protein CheD [Bdellovibrionales bacterium]
MSLGIAQKKKTHVGIAQFAASSDPSEMLIAANLGSCLGVAVFDRKAGVGGMVHCLLPLSKSDPEKAKENPCMYVDTGVAHLLNQLLNLGASKERLEVCVAGGANIADTTNVFEIGKKNFTILRKILWKNNLLIAAQDVGESVSRTITLDMETGEIKLRREGKESLLFDGGSHVL